jgi:hypothetical protein
MYRQAGFVDVPQACISDQQSAYTSHCDPAMALTNGCVHSSFCRLDGEPIDSIDPYNDKRDGEEDCGHGRSNDGGEKDDSLLMVMRLEHMT